MREQTPWEVTASDPAPTARLGWCRSRAAAALAALVLGVALLPAAAAGESFATAAPTSAAADTAAPGPATGPGSGVWAVVIGIDHYPDASETLQSAKNDALEMDQLLVQDDVPADHQVTLLDSQATGTNIRLAVDWLVRHSTDATTAVLFYAGHVDKLSRSTEALLGSDGDLVTDADLAARMQGLHARNAWITIAGCYAGGFDELLAPGRLLVAASDATSLSYENEALGRSYLVDYMIRRAMVNGAAGSSVQDAFGYAVSNLQRDFPNRVPLLYDETSGPIDLREPATPPPPPPPDPAPAAAAPAPAPPEATPPPAPAADPVPPPIATITTAIDKVAQLRDKLVGWLSGSTLARAGIDGDAPMATVRFGRTS